MRTFTQNNISFILKKEVLYMKSNHQTMIIILIIIFGFFVSTSIKKIADEFSTSSETPPELITQKIKKR